MKITVPYGWSARDYQIPFFSAMEHGCKRAVIVWHRRCGKDLTALNFTITQLVQRPGIYWHILPTYAQGRKIVWEGVTKDGRKFLDHFPGHEEYENGERDGFVIRKRNDEMSLFFANGAKWQVIGAEDPDSLVGTNAFGMVFSEYSIYESSKIWTLLSPVLEENGGWAIFIFTPRGRNHAYKILQTALESDYWFGQVLTINDTHIISEEQIQRLRDEGIPEHEIEQEWYCSFDAPLEGAYYGDLLRLMEKDGRVCDVPWEPMLPVRTMWDLGVDDATAIWFYQYAHGQHRLIDFEWCSDVGLEHYAKLVLGKPYVYDKHYLPHDIKVRELGKQGAQSREKTLRQLGIFPTIVPNVSREDGINATRMLIPKLWMDRKKCEKGLEGLKEYVRKKSQDLVDPEGNPLFIDSPKEGWPNHPADALRMGAVMLRGGPGESGSGMNYGSSQALPQPDVSGIV